MGGKDFIHCLACCLLVIGTLLPCEVHSREGSNTTETQEYKLKAAFLVNFIRFISWPSEAYQQESGKFHLCIEGGNPFGDELERAQTQRFNKRSLDVVYDGSKDELKKCQMIFIGVKEQEQARALLSLLQDRPVVTVSDIPGFIDMGGSIEFVVKNGRLMFIINQTGLHQRSINVSASMLSLAVGLR